MKLYWVIVMQAILTIWATSAAIAGPIAEFAPTSFDIGKPIEGETVKAVFQVKNIGDADLDITNVRAGCGCTKAKATESKILPGKTTTIEAVFNTSGFPNQVRKHITVMTNDPTHQSVDLTIEGEVVPIAKLKPQSYLNVGDVKPGAVRLSDITVLPNIKQPFRILGIETTGNSVSVLQYDKKKNKYGNYAVKIRVKASTTTGRFYEQLLMMTDLPGSPVIQFLVYGNVINEAAKDNSRGNS